MVNAFGKCMRRIRGEESLRTCAKRLEITASFLSAMEVGKRTVPDIYYEKIKELYNLNEEQSKELYESIIYTNQRVDIEITKMNKAQQQTTVMFARKIESANPELVEKLRKVLSEEGE